MLIPFLGATKSGVCVTQMELGVTQSYAGVTQVGLDVAQSYAGAAQVELNVAHLGVGAARAELIAAHLGVGAAHAEVGSAQSELGLGMMFEMLVLAEHFDSDGKLVEMKSLLDFKGSEDAFNRQDWIPDLPTIVEDWKSSEENFALIRSTMLPFERGVIGELIENALGSKDGKFE